MKATGTCSISTSNAVVSNPGGLLMVQTNSVMPTATSENNVINSCYVINSDPLSKVTQQSHFITNVLSDQDILSMPTVIVCEERNGKTNANGASVLSSKCIFISLFC